MGVDKSERPDASEGKACRVRCNRSPGLTNSPPKKKHRLYETQNQEAKRERKREVTRLGAPEETPKNELEFPNRRSAPERPPDEHGFFRYRYGDSIVPRYKIISELGEGTFGLVLECWDRKEKKFVAVKIIRAIEKYRVAAMMELEVLNTLKFHDSLSDNRCIGVDGWFNFRGHVCMVFPKLGPSLFDFMKKNNFHSFEVGFVRDIARQLLKAVGFMHSLEVTHTDLKPENILLFTDGYDKRSSTPDSITSEKRVPLNSEIRVIDFGSATFESDHHGRVVSTRHYRAPEVVVGAKWSYECDLWSVGCILVELITGETLFQTHDDIEHLAMMQQVLGTIPKSLGKKCDRQARHLFDDDYKLNWPEGARDRKSIKAVRRLLDLDRWILEVGDESVRPEIDEFVDLVKGLMKFEPSERLSANDALQHKFFSKSYEEKGRL